MYQGEELSYNEFWHFIKERQDIKWYVMAYGGNFSFLRTSLKNYLKVAEILDIDEEDEDGKNEAGYKRMYFQQYEEHDDKFVEAGGLPLDDWPSSDYNIKVHNIEPLEILIDWYDRDEGFRDIILLRDHEDMLER